jgi:hypothetical protein
MSAGERNRRSLEEGRMKTNQDASPGFCWMSQFGEDAQDYVQDILTKSCPN